MRGGIIFFEAYSQSQLSRSTGGPKDVDMLMTAEDIQKEFPNCRAILCHEVEREVVEGEFHTGLASVVQFIGKKKGTDWLGTIKNVLCQDLAVR